MGLPVISSILSLGEKLIDKLLPDPAAKAAALQKLAELEQSGDLAVIAGQVEINKIEAASGDRFVNGWRPFVGWVCGGGLALQIVILPMLSGFSALFGHPMAMPILDVSLLTTLLVGMLGLGGMRTVEKLQGVASK